MRRLLVGGERPPFGGLVGAYQVIAGGDADRNDRQALLAPVFMLSFLLDALLAERDQFGAERVVVTSASSKAALGPGAPVAAARRARRRADVGSQRGLRRGTGCLRHVVSYDDRDHVGDGTAAVIDVAGDQVVANALSDALADRLRQHVSAGFTHRVRDTRDDEGEGGLGTLFFAPDQMIARTREWDRGEFRDRFAAALDDFAGWTTAWLRLVRASGADAVDAAYYRTRRGQVAPTDGVILSLHPRGRPDRC